MEARIPLLQLWGVSTDRHYIAIMVDESYLGGTHNRWRTVANGKTRDDAINQIPTIINDLQSLYNQVKGGNHERTTGANASKKGD